MSLRVSELRDARDAALADQISRYFVEPNQNQKLQYLGLAGVGRHGGALLFNERGDDGRPSRKIIVKYSLTQEADWDLQNEAHWLNVLKGAEHIVEIITLPGATVDVTGTGKRPTVALEFIPHGTIHQFLERFITYYYQVREPPSNLLMPTRFLWRLFLCFVRQIVAMTWPPQGKNPDIPDQREIIKPGEPVVALTQNSSHFNNFVFGNSMMGDVDHHQTPILKMIDFGRGRIENSYEQAYLTNLWGAAYNIACMALPYEDRDALRGRPHDYFLREPITIGEHVTSVITTEAPMAFTSLQQIDWKLRDTVARCMASNDSFIPTLPELLRICEDAVDNRRIADFDLVPAPNPFLVTRESDAHMRWLVQTLIFDADVSGADPEPGLDRPSWARQLGNTMLGIHAAPDAPETRDRAGEGGDTRPFAERLATAIHTSGPRYVPPPPPPPRAGRPGRGRRTLYERFVRRLAGMQRAPTPPGPAEPDEGVD